MKLRNICEAKTQAELDAEANTQRQEQIKKVLEAAEQAFLKSDVAQIMEDNNKTFADLLNLARNEAVLLHSDNTKQVEILDCLGAINPKIANIPISSPPRNVIDWWSDAITDVNGKLINQFNKLQLESKQYTLEEGILSSIGGIFTKAIKFLIQTTVAGLAAGAAFGAALAGSKYGGGYRSGGKGTGSQMRGQVDTKYKIALLNAKYIDALLQNLEPTAKRILQDANVQSALTTP